MLQPRQQRELNKAMAFVAGGGDTVDLSLLQMGVDMLQVIYFTSLAQAAAADIAQNCFSVRSL
jgi:hypothetical protein